MDPAPTIDLAALAAADWAGANPLSPAYRDDPYPMLHALRARDPVNQTPLGPWRLTRYADVARLLKEGPVRVTLADGTSPNFDPEDQRGSKQHRRFNELLLARGYERLRAYEATLEADYDALRGRPLAFRLAYAAGFETMALAIGHMLVRHRRFFFQDADPAVSSLVLWHFVEEVEHKRAAFDVFEAVVGSYPTRIRGLAYAVWHTLRRTRQAYVLLLREDGLWGTRRTRLRLKLLMCRIAAACVPRLLESLLPWHDPARVADPPWIREWIALYERGEPGLTRLDTRRMDLGPAAMIA